MSCEAVTTSPKYAHGVGALVRALALVLAILMLAGCTGKPTTEPASPSGAAGASSNSAPSAAEAASPRPSLTGLTVSGPAPSGTLWLDQGGSLELKATQPSNAAGAPTYVWAVGALPGTALIKTVAMPDTGSKDAANYVPPGASSTLKFTTPGSWLMHCHLHPGMQANVSVIEGYQGPAQVDVYVTDERFVPENIAVGRGTSVVYHNVGKLPHTATAITQDPPLKVIPGFQGTKGGTIKFDATMLGWQRVRLFALDAEGRFGVAQYDAYVALLPGVFAKDVPFEFQAPSPSAAPVPVQGPTQATFATAWNGTIFVNFTAEDAAAPATSAAGQNLAQVTVRLRVMGDPKVIVAKEKASDGQLTARIPAGSYTVEIAYEQGADTKGSAHIDVVYDVVPPSPSKYVDSESIPHQH